MGAIENYLYFWCTNIIFVDFKKNIICLFLIKIMFTRFNKTDISFAYILNKTFTIYYIHLKNYLITIHVEIQIHYKSIHFKESKRDV